MIINDPIRDDVRARDAHNRSAGLAQRQGRNTVASRMRRVLRDQTNARRRGLVDDTVVGPIPTLVPARVWASGLSKWQRDRTKRPGGKRPRGGVR